ncbi:hypothetical protein QTJ16_006842 [Diplocarpon rosae]|uniref:AMP-dependent synthetase/ligase domain-containing protein n=1 Tax=Diplocarpon rosae TaxID=946125 RepID=A0AAD9STY3_9HELO|nr:hypothetical protein QTJ16_006842 [Diplocarpon rosae]PBP26774.1 AMP-dependent synthetase/ligase [Diplocarpon rosae]
MGFDNLMVKLDEAVTSVLGEWDIYSTGIFAIVVSVFIHHVFTSRDPDAHPMLLARQAQASPIRQKGESAVFRSHSAPHGIPLNSGLNIKDPGDSKWSRGRDGDLRDIWRKAVAGGVDWEGKETGEIGRLLTVFGSQKVVEHNLDHITRQINFIGQQIRHDGGSNVAIYLPNSIEFLATLFACAFYDLTVTLLPYELSIEEIVSLLHKSRSDTIIAAAGAFPFDAITKSYPSLQQLIWVVDEGSRHMDWNEVPKGTGGKVNVSTWSEIISDQEPSAGRELPPVDKKSEPKKVLAFWPSGELVEFTHANIIAGVAGQLTSVPATQRITHADLFLPADSLSTMYSLVLTLTALQSNASVALNSVADESPDLAMATQGIAPTIIVATAKTLAKTHAEAAVRLNSSFYKIVHWFQTRSLVQEGVMPLASIFSRAFDSLRPAVGNTPGKLRLIYVSKPAGVNVAPLSSQVLSDLRVYTRSRIIYALTAARVAGAVTQTGLYDYRVDNDPETLSHFGSPVTSVEVLLKDSEQHKTTDTSSAGEIFARGPAVVGGEASVGVNGKIREDHTLALL